MENVTIYSHYINFEKALEIIKSKLPKAKIKVDQEGLNKTIILTSGGLFSKKKALKILYRQRKNPSYTLEKVECDLSGNIGGMYNFVNELPADNEEIRGKFLHKILSMNSEMSFVAEPYLSDEIKAAIKEIVIELDGFIFAPSNSVANKSTEQQFLDKNLNLIIDLSGKCEVDQLDITVEAKYHDQPVETYTEEQIQRKNTSIDFLKSRQIKVMEALPCVPSSENVNIRTPKEIVDRAYALLVIAAKGEGVEQELLEKSVEEKNIEGFSPMELVMYNLDELDHQMKANATWRYESLNVIMWALGMVDNLVYPSEICDVPDIVGKIFQPTRPEFEASINVRNKAEILDELDKIYRMHWACVDARINNEEIPSNLNPSIIYERHYALNWLVNWNNAEWDDVQTPT